VPRDHAEAVKWLHRGTESYSYGVAEICLAKCYFYGDGVEKDYAKAARWLLDATFTETYDGDEIGHLLGRFYGHCLGMSEDRGKAEGLWRSPADAVLRSAQLGLGSLYNEGESRWQRYAEDAKQLHEDVEAGSNAWLRFCLGLVYLYGRGVKPDDGEAIKWFRTAADAGEPFANFHLGLAYAHGRGLIKDEAEAAERFRRAAELGHVDAEFKFGVAHAIGEGVPQDYVQAYQWSALAAAHYPERETEARNRAAANCELLVRRMSGGELARAQHLVREWRPTRSREPWRPSPPIGPCGWPD
jgi:uncharacterized protein